MFAADWGVGQVLWTMIYFFFLFAFIWILITVLIDLFRDHTLSGVAKALWVIFLIFLPLIGTIVYLIARGGGMHERAAQAAARQQKAMDEYIRQTPARPVAVGPPSRSHRPTSCSRPAPSRRPSSTP